MSTTRERGNEVETFVCKHLKKNGHQILHRNFHCRMGEIDIISNIEKTLVFTEVRYRKSLSFMDPIETIDPKKCQRIIRTAEYFLKGANSFTDHDIRFDVITVTGRVSSESIQWIENAFQA